MANKATIDSLIVKLENLEKINMKEPLTKACLVVEEEAKRLCPVDTGQLRGSITYEVEGNVGRIGTNAEYAPYVEFGTGLFSSKGDGRKDVPWRYQDPEGGWHTTSGQNPQPYLQPALDMNKGRIIDIFKEAINKELKK